MWKKKFCGRIETIESKLIVLLVVAVAVHLGASEKQQKEPKIRGVWFR